MKIATVLDKIDDYQLFVPAFQREYVWKRDDAKLLMDSLIKEYPFGTMLSWETSNPPELKGQHKYHEAQGAVRILLDGQQRVTTLYMLIRGVLPPYYTEGEIANDTRGLYVNLETLELSYYMKMRMANNPLWQDITSVFQKKVRAKDVIRALEAKGEVVSRERDDLIDDNAKKIEGILDRTFPEQTIPIRATVREAIDIFYMVNASGVSLTDAELALAQISGYWPEARDLFKAKLAQLADEGMALKLDFVVYALLGCMYHAGSDMKKLHGEENSGLIRSAWARLESEVLDYVVNVMRTHAYVDHTDEISSVYALIPIIVYCYDRGDHLSDQEIRKIVKWFYYSQIRTRYTSQLQQKLDRDLRVLVESENPFDQLLRVIEEESRLTIEPYEFEGRAVQHPLFGLVRWYLKSRNALCLTTGVGLRKNMGSAYKLENDHMFPFSRLKAAGYGKGNRVKYALAQEMTNRALLTQVANRAKSNTTAGEYLRSVKQRFPDALSLQCIPDDESLWQIENYEAFLAERRRVLARHLNEFLAGITETANAQLPVSIEHLIADGESDELEFKSSLRWDLRESRANTKLEEVIAKSVAAFANWQGGTLLIGVDDDGGIVGLGPDFASLHGDRDKFELHLRNVLNQYFGKAFSATRIKVSFHDVEDKVICQVEVRPASEPLLLRVSESHGRQIERFYVRSGNSSQELPPSEMNAYVRERFA